METATVSAQKWLKMVRRLGVTASQPQANRPRFMRFCLTCFDHFGQKWGQMFFGIFFFADRKSAMVSQNLAKNAASWATATLIFVQNFPKKQIDYWIECGYRRTVINRRKFSTPYRLVRWTLETNRVAKVDFSRWSFFSRVRVSFLESRAFFFVSRACRTKNWE